MSQDFQKNSPIEETKEELPKLPEELNEELPEVLTVEEIARLLRINNKTVRELYHRGELPGRKLGSKILRFSRSAVLQWLRAGCASQSRRKK